MWICSSLTLVSVVGNLGIWVGGNEAIEMCGGDGPVAGMQIELVDIAPLPFLNTDLEVDGGFPAPVDAFRKKIVRADAYLFASPEYNYSLSGRLKLFYFGPVI